MSSNYFNSLLQQSPGPRPLSGMTWNLKTFSEELRPPHPSSSSWDQTRLARRQQGQTYFRKSHGKSSSRSRHRRVPLCFIWSWSRHENLMEYKEHACCTESTLLHWVIKEDQKQESHRRLFHFSTATFPSSRGSTGRLWRDERPRVHISTCRANPSPYFLLLHILFFKKIIWNFYLLWTLTLNLDFRLACFMEKCPLYRGFCLLAPSQREQQPARRSAQRFSIGNIYFFFVGNGVRVC